MEGPGWSKGLALGLALFFGPGPLIFWAPGPLFGPRALGPIIPLLYPGVAALLLLKPGCLGVAWAGARMA